MRSRFLSALPLALLCACGGANQAPVQDPGSQPPIAEDGQGAATDPMTEAAQPAPSPAPADAPPPAAPQTPAAGAAPAGGELAKNPSDPAQAPAEAPADAAPAAAPAGSTRAVATLAPAEGDAPKGEVRFDQVDKMVTMRVRVEGLKKGKYGLTIHEKGDCGRKGKSAGGHFNPTKAKHGPPSSGTRHAGDFGNIEAGDDGVATLEIATDSITLVQDGPSSILGRAILVHKRPDDGKKGNSGAGLACGVINAQ